jgi:hypothetical protein
MSRVNVPGGAVPDRISSPAFIDDIEEFTLVIVLHGVVGEVPLLESFPFGDM